MKNKLFILQRLGKKYDYQTRYFEIFKAPIGLLLDLGLLDDPNTKTAEFSLGFYYNVNTGQIDLKSYIKHVKVHLGNLELTLDNNICFTPHFNRYGTKQDAYYDEHFGKWNETSYKNLGHEYLLSDDDYIKMAHSNSLSGKLQFAYLKESKFRVDDVIFQQFKDFILVRLSSDPNLIDSIYEKYRNSLVDDNEETDKRAFNGRYNYLEDYMKNSGTINLVDEKIKYSNIILLVVVVVIVVYLLKNC